MAKAFDRIKAGLESAIAVAEGRADPATYRIHEPAPASTVREDRDWNAYTKNLLRAEMTRRRVTYKGLVEKLAALGISETEASLRNKIGQGEFTGAFLIQCLVAMGVMCLRLEE